MIVERVRAKAAGKHCGRPFIDTKLERRIRDATGYPGRAQGCTRPPSSSAVGVVGLRFGEIGKPVMASKHDHLAPSPWRGFCLAPPAPSAGSLPMSVGCPAVRRKIGAIRRTVREGGLLDRTTFCDGHHIGTGTLGPGSVVSPREARMSAEIFLLRLEATARAAKEAATITRREHVALRSRHLAGADAEGGLTSRTT